MVNEAKYLLNFDFENDMTDLNKLYPGALSGELPDRILRISVSKQCYTHYLLSPLHCACINPNPSILKQMLKICPTFSLPDKNRRNLVHYAAANENGEIIKFLVQNGCDPNELDGQRKTPLMVASDLGKLDVVLTLIDHFKKKGLIKGGGADSDEGS
jgi:ankyrin repeat protein